MRGRESARAREGERETTRKEGMEIETVVFVTAMVGIQQKDFSERERILRTCHVTSRWPNLAHS